MQNLVGICKEMPKELRKIDKLRLNIVGNGRYRLSRCLPFANQSQLFHPNGSNRFPYQNHETVIQYILLYLIATC